MRLFSHELQSEPGSVKEPPDNQSINQSITNPARICFYLQIPALSLAGHVTRPGLSGSTKSECLKCLKTNLQKAKLTRAETLSLTQLFLYDLSLTLTPQESSVLLTGVKHSRSASQSLINSARAITLASMLAYSKQANSLSQLAQSPGFPQVSTLTRTCQCGVREKRYRAAKGTKPSYNVNAGPSEAVVNVTLVMSHLFQCPSPRQQCACANYCSG